MGATRGQAALAAGLEGGIAVVAGVVLAVVGAYAVSPLAPVGPVRRFDPARGFEADPLVLAGGGAVLALVLLGVLAVLAWRTVRPAGREPAVRPSVIAAAAAAAGLPVAAVIGARHALERGSGPRPAAVRASLAGSAAAVTAVVMAAVFGASLNGLVSHPARYGWNWDLLIEAEGGYGNWKPAVMDQLVDHQPGVTGWSQFGFSQVLIDGREVPVMGLQREVGSVEPPTTSGHPIAGPGQIELGTSTLRQLGKQVGGTGEGGHREDGAHAHDRRHGDAALVRADLRRSRVAGPRRHAARKHAAGHPGHHRRRSEPAGCRGLPGLPVCGGHRHGSRHLGRCPAAGQPDHLGRPGWLTGQHLPARPPARRGHPERGPDGQPAAGAGDRAGCRGGAGPRADGAGLGPAAPQAAGRAQGPGPAAGASSGRSSPGRSASSW